MSRPVEVTMKFVTSVPSLAEAWAFVMEHIDEVGDDPVIVITPLWLMEDDTREFEVKVEGMVSRGS